MVCGAPLTPPAKCGGCGHDVLPRQKVCPYCGKESGAAVAAVPATPLQGRMFAPAPPPEPAPKAPEPAATLPPRPAPLPEDEFAKGPSIIRIFRIVFRVLVLACVVGVLFYCRSVAGFWPVLATVLWFILASRPLTYRVQHLQKSAPMSRNYMMKTGFGSSNYPLTLALVAVSVIAWLVLFIAAFRKDFGSSKAALIIGFFLFLGSMLTNYQYKATKTRVVDPDFEQHVEEFGWTVALIRQYYVWGLAAPFIHAAFRVLY